MTAPAAARAVWRKSSRSGPNDSNCVEVAGLPGLVGVRDSKDQAGPVLLFTQRSWASFTDRLRVNDINPSGPVG